MTLYICPDWLSCEYSRDTCTHNIPHKHNEHCSIGLTERDGYPKRNYAHPYGCLKCVEYKIDFIKEDEFKFS